MGMLDRSRVESAWRNACEVLVADSTSQGWRGYLSSSAIATSVAAAALHFSDSDKHAERLSRAFAFLLSDQNADGGWGDSPESPSNLAATLLTWGVLRLAPADLDVYGVVARAEVWLREQCGGISADEISGALARRYGNDKTFAGPILMFVTACGRLGEGRQAWADVLQLPFELAAAPPVLWKWLRLSVVSYGLPALVAVGLARHRNLPTRNPLTRVLRALCEKRVLRLCESMQPSNGGFEEAAPLTGFVAVGLTAAGHGKSIIVERCVEFLVNGQREDGSWPIDTDLATWVTTLAINALSEHAEGLAVLPKSQQKAILNWILDQQHREQHPLTYTAPGGWAWSDLEGAMPDADDTPGAMMAILRLGGAAEHSVCVERAAEWLMSIQNRDGGIPTFSKGWGKLPFDRSCPDLTSHVLRAFCEWQDAFSDELRCQVRASATKMLGYLRASQASDGSWVPLWFGNQYTGDRQQNRTYGTAQTAIALRAVQDAGYADVSDSLNRACEWLESVQQSDGSWGSDAVGKPASIEETALATRALIAGGPLSAAERGIQWLLKETCGGMRFATAPIGLYFAVLFYSERMYPIVWTIGVLGAWLERGRRSEVGGRRSEGGGRRSEGGGQRSGGRRPLAGCNPAVTTGAGGVNEV